MGSIPRKQRESNMIEIVSVGILAVLISDEEPYCECQCGNITERGLIPQPIAGIVYV